MLYVQTNDTLFSFFSLFSNEHQGFGSDDDNKVYDKALFADRSNASIYRNTNEIALDDDEDDGKPVE